jgi:hypothetical protein
VLADDTEGQLRLCREWDDNKVERRAVKTGSVTDDGIAIIRA